MEPNIPAAATSLTASQQQVIWAGGDRAEAQGGRAAVEHEELAANAGVENHELWATAITRGSPPLSRPIYSLT